MDKAHRETDAVFEKIEKKLTEIYTRADKEIRAEWDKYLDKFKDKAAKLQKAILNAKGDEREKAEKERLEQQKISENLPFRTVGQVLTTYLILERGEEIYFIDQHAAHERLLYDRFKASFQGNGSNAQQPMLIPYVLNVNPTEFDFLDGKLSYLRKMGFEIEYNDDSSYVVYQIPYLLCDIDLKAFFDDLLSDLGLRKVEIPELVNEKLMQKACKAAIKSGMTLSQSEIDSLLKEINGDMGLKCPHGRPIAVRISRAEIDKWFKRIV